MSFEKAKDVVTQNAPNVKRVEAVLQRMLSALQKMSKAEEHVTEVHAHGRWELSFGDINSAIEDITTIHDYGAISEHTYEEILRNLKLASRSAEAENLGPMQSGLTEAIGYLQDIAAKDVAKWTRAPRVVGTGRKVKE